MRAKLATISLFVIGLSGISVPLLAHHGNASYDNTKTVTVKGTVTEYIWANPHVYLKMDAKDESGNVQHWIIEAENPVHMADGGWGRNTFKAGDEVEVDVVPVKNGQPIGRVRNRILINGQPFKGQAPQ